MKAAKKLVFSVVWKTLKIAKVGSADFDGCDVDLYSVLVWTIREQRLHSHEDKQDKEFNIKLDGCPLGGLFYYQHVLVVNLRNLKGCTIVLRQLWLMMSQHLRVKGFNFIRSTFSCNYLY